MPSLREVQQAILASIVGRDDGAVDGLVVGGRIAPAGRLSIYRNTFESTLTRALRLSFPAIDRLVGGEFFDEAAMVYVHEAPPRSGWLDEYGGGFADFLEGFPPAASVPYLPGVARLDWAASRAACAYEAPPLSADDLGALPEAGHERIRFVSHPSLTLLRADYPVDEIRRAVLEEDDAALAAIDLDAGEVMLVVERRDGLVMVSRLDPAAWRLAAALGRGQPLGAALAEYGEGTDAPALIAEFLATGRFVGFSLSPDNGGYGVSEVSP